VSRQYVFFLLAGGCAAGVNVLSRVCLSLATSYELAIVAAHLIGMTVAFGLNRQYVFSGARGPAAAQYGRFALVNVLSLAQTWLLSVTLAHHVFPAAGLVRGAETVAHAIAVSTLAVTSYHGHKFFSFSQSGSGAEVYSDHTLKRLGKRT
jgi:putative flippase GtrA